MSQLQFKKLLTFLGLDGPVSETSKSFEAGDPADLNTTVLPPLMELSPIRGEKEVPSGKLKGEDDDAISAERGECDDVRMDDPPRWFISGAEDFRSDLKKLLRDWMILLRGISGEAMELEE